MRLDELADRHGLVVEDLASRRKKNRGALVLLKEAYLDDFLWFIPENTMTNSGKMPVGCCRDSRWCRMVATQSCRAAEDGTGPLPIE